MTAKRIFQVYRQESAHHKDEPVGVLHVQPTPPGCWRFRVIAARNKKKVGGSGEAFDSKGNALRAARREASFYQPGTAAVEVLG